TSGINGEGKSTIAWNLARYQARLGKKVCYLQFDHQPSTYWAEKKNKKALNDYLRGKGSIEESLETGTVDRAYAIWGEDLKEIIRSHAGEQLFQVLGQRYDLVIVDGPGIVDDDYAINLCRRVDTILYVVGSTKTKTRLVDSAMQELEQNGIVPTGIVLNRVKASYCGNDPRLAVERKRSRRWGRTEKKA
ncbi:MAG: hypothetical protein KDK78_12155, partial [Chlamydiia bacterium]|nr:hypothetical protein [Chlamydiia bacterium]